ncbi:hypothetical protein PCCS19_33000 [Paenibacillus sp. CCS19]|uniref:hypothetical protein n=1 Tax=Paenibacillus sp. CCS19 TaxID=3158387 RepID=UPI002569D1BC|nr:hypothetical protein [Paenibacillus cellulosilyticus]GMK40245.1 hypothetical protein PCCS19_33000 [Paenibacillus cellulosilyticus]
MSNSQLQLQQFERNRYFYGKLLSVKDFQLEQNYYIEKRSLLNRFVHGTGVIGGLHLSQIDGTGVRLTPGTAIDAAGREIVVAANLDVADISKLAGYPSNYPPAKDDIIYAVISYDEIAREPVPPVSNATASTDGIELNKIRETFKFSLTKDAPAAAGSLESAYRETVIVFENDQFIVHRSVPRVANPGDVIEVVLTVRTKLQQSGSSLVEITESLPSQFTMLSAWKDNKIPFNLGGLAGGVTRTQRYYARAGEMPTSGVISSQVLFNSVLQTVTGGESSLAVVEDRSIVRLLAERYFDQQPDTGSSDHIVLAAITINNKGIITSIDESVRPYIYNNELLFQLMLADKQRPAQLPTHAASHADGGADELNVTNLSGVLADPQKVQVQDEGSSLTVRTKINFTGAGVTASDDSTNGRTTINIPGMTTHAGTHAKGGTDELNVNNLSGTLADPQKVVIQEEGTALPARSKINFIGAGVTAVDDVAGGRTNVTISGAAASHAGTHAKGGTDELNVNNLSGTLADPQKVSVLKDGTAYTARSKINFTGTGVSVSDDTTNGRINVNITGGSQTAGAQIATGSILFQSMYPGEVRVSPFISHPLPSTNIGIILSVVHSISLDGLPDESVSGGLQTSLLPNKLIAGEALSATSLASTTNQTSQLSQTLGNQTPPTIPIPDIPIIPGLTSTVKAGDAAFIEADLPYVMAQYPTTTNIGFQVKIQDKRNNDGFEQTKDWIVRWWAVIGTVDTGTVTVPAYGAQTSLTGGSKLDDTSVVKLPDTDTPVIKVPIDDTPIIKLPVDDTPIIKLPTDETPIIKVPIDGTPIIRQPIEQVELMSALRATDSSIDAAALNAESVAESEAIEAKLADIVVEPVKKTRRSSKASAQPIESATETGDTSES